MYVAYFVSGLLMVMMLAEVIALFTPLRTKARRSIPKELVSILLVVRNEEEGIEACVSSLLNQSHANYELLIADDDSTDSTKLIIRRLIKGKTNVKFMESPVPSRNGVNPKASNLNVLQAASRGEYVAIADGDCIYPPTWLNSLLSYKPETGIVSGVTGIEGSRMQNIDWMTAVGRISLLNSWGFLTSAVGNNMLFDRKVYEETSGWEGVSKQLTEDFELNREIVKAGYPSVVVIHPTVLVKSRPASFRKLFSQRKRWMHGIRSISPLLKLFILLDALVLIFALLLAVVMPLTGLLLIGSYILLRAVVDMRLVGKVDRHLLFWVPLYQIYRMGMNVGFLSYNLAVRKVNWKGRNYD